MRAFSALLAPWLLLALACSSLPAKAPRVGPGQYLFRVEARSQEREAHLRVVLRFAGERRFQIGAADLVGRTVWTFAVAGDHFLWADHRQRKVCRGEASEALALPLLTRVVAAHRGKLRWSRSPGLRVEFGWPIGAAVEPTSTSEAAGRSPLTAGHGSA